MKQSIPFSFRTLEIYTQVVDSQGMTQAAKELNTSQSAVSHTINALESSLDCLLLKRHRRKVITTHTGELFYRQASSILQMAKDTTLSIQAATSNPPLRIGMVDSFAMTAAARITRLLSSTSDSITIRSGTSPYIMDAMKQGILDAAIGMEPVLDTNNTVSHRLLQEGYLLAVPKGLSLLQTRIEFLCQEMDFIHYSSNSANGRRTLAYLSRFGYKPRRRLYEFESNTVVMEMVANKLGWSLVTPLELLQAPQFSESIDFIDLPEPGCFRELFITTRTWLPETASKRLHDTLVQVMQQLRPKIEKTIPWLKAQAFEVFPYPHEHHETTVSKKENE